MIFSLSYPQGFIDSVINSKGRSCLNKEEKPLGFVYPSCEGCFGEAQVHRESITLGQCSKLNTLRKPSQKVTHKMAQSIFSVRCECGRRYTGKICRPQAVWLSEHKNSLKLGLLEKSK
jgi:hypothetical protein